MKTKILFLLMLFLSISASAQTFTYTYEGQTLTYQVTDESKKTCEVSRNSNISGSVIIPSEANGYSVVSIGWYAFANCSGLTSVTIPNSVTSIGKQAFEYCI